MKQFEYDTIYRSREELEELNEVRWLDNLGNDGWELVMVIKSIVEDNWGMKYYFKRELKTTRYDVGPH